MKTPSRLPVLVLAVGILASFAPCAPAVGILFWSDFEECSPPQLSGEWVVEYPASASAVQEGLAGDLVPHEASVAGGWQATTLGAHPEGVTPYSESLMAVFRGWREVPEHTSARLSTAASMDFRYPAGLKVMFYMYHDSGYPESKDSLQPQISTDGGSTWADLGESIPRYSETPGWTRYDIFLDGYVGLTDMRIGFLANGGDGNDIFLDMVGVAAINGSTLDCTPGYLGLGTPFTITGAKFGVKKGTVLLGSDAKAIKVISWSDSAIVCALKKTVARSYYDMTIVPKVPVGALPIWVPDAVSIEQPDPQSMTPESGPPGTLVTLPCRTMGTKKGTVELVSSVPPGQEEVYTRCKVKSWMDRPYPESRSSFPSFRREHTGHR